MNQNYQRYQSCFVKPSPVKPLMAFGYFGGKAREAAYIADLLSYDDTVETYIEPFGGAAAVLLNKPPHKYEVYADKSLGLCCFWKAMSERGTAYRIIERLSDTSYDKTGLPSG